MFTQDLEISEKVGPIVLLHSESSSGQTVENFKMSRHDVTSSSRVHHDSYRVKRVMSRIVEKGGSSRVKKGALHVYRRKREPFTCAP